MGQYVIEQNMPELFSCLSVLNRLWSMLKQESVASKDFSLVNINFMLKICMLTHVFGTDNCSV